MSFQETATKTTRHVLSVFLLGMFVIHHSVMAESYVPYGHKFEPMGDYQTRTAPIKGRSTYLKDPNVWVYTSAFAKRFAMPERWIDDSLQGAEAVAFRVVASNIQSCGYFGDSEACSPSIRCIFDIYLTDEDSAKLPWESHKSDRWRKSDTSMQFLSAQTEEDYWYWTDEVQNRRYVYRGILGLRSVVYVEGPPTNKNGRYQAFSGQGPMRVSEYRRDFYKGLDLIELSGCGLPYATKPAGIYFLDPQPSMYDPRYRLPDGSINRPKLDAAKKARYANFNAGTPPHKVMLPDNYMVKVRAHDEAERYHRSLERAVKERLLSKGKQR